MLYAVKICCQPATDRKIFLADPFGAVRLVGIKALTV